MEYVKQETKELFAEFLEKTSFKKGNVIVIGCSTSEVVGGKIGKKGSSEVAKEIYSALADLAQEKGVYLAFQCCEHLNRALVVEEKVAQMLNLEEVSVVPYPHAGGSMASFAYRAMEHAVVVEHIKADGGIDIGETLIGMHLKHVAVPLRLEKRHIGEARVNCAYTRNKLIGGERAKYTLE